MSDIYVPLVTPPAERAEPAVWLAFRKGEVLVVRNASQPALPCCMDLAEHGLAAQRHHYLGTYGGQHCYAAEVAESAPLPEGWATLGLRDLFGMVETTLAALSGRAWQILEWERNFQYCSRCGMILITHGKKLLLARKAAFPTGRYSALAGFVEPGEMLEDTVIRETREEVGVEVKNIRYFGSQPWPFPHSLMIAFTAEYAGGELRPDGVEIEECAWFDPDALPKLPPPISISRRLIDTVSAQLRGKKTVDGQD
jgi:NAD+ diphosphatase